MSETPEVKTRRRRPAMPPEQREAIRQKLLGREQAPEVVRKLRDYAEHARNNPGTTPLCTVCGKPLFGAEAIARGAGPICAGLKPKRLYQAKYTPEERAARRAAREAEKAQKRSEVQARKEARAAAKAQLLVV